MSTQKLQVHQKEFQQASLNNKSLPSVFKWFTDEGFRIVKESPLTVFVTAIIIITYLFRQIANLENMLKQKILIFLFIRFQNEIVIDIRK